MSRRKRPGLSPEEQALAARLLADPGDSGSVYQALKQAVDTCGPRARARTVARQALETLARGATIEQIRAIDWRGNHYRDRSAFDVVHDFVANASNPLAERIEALQIATRDGMGEPDLVDEAYLLAYLEETS